MEPGLSTKKVCSRLLLGAGGQKGPKENDPSYRSRRSTSRGMGLLSLGEQVHLRLVIFDVSEETKKWLVFKRTDGMHFLHASLADGIQTKKSYTWMERRPHPGDLMGVSSVKPLTQ